MQVTGGNLPLLLTLPVASSVALDGPFPSLCPQFCH